MSCPKNCARGDARTRCPVFRSCIRSPALHTRARARSQIRTCSTQEGGTESGHALLGAGLGDAAGDDVRDDVPRLDPRKEQLADLAQPAHRVEVRLAERAHPARRQS